MPEEDCFVTTPRRVPSKLLLWTVMVLGFIVMTAGLILFAGTMTFHTHTSSDCVAVPRTSHQSHNTGLPNPDDNPTIDGRHNVPPPIAQAPQGHGANAGGHSEDPDRPFCSANHHAAIKPWFARQPLWRSIALAVIGVVIVTIGDSLQVRYHGKNARKDKSSATAGPNEYKALH